MVAYWHDSVICVSVCPSVTLCNPKGFFKTKAFNLKAKDWDIVVKDHAAVQLSIPRTDIITTVT